MHKKKYLPTISLAAIWSLQFVLFSLINKKISPFATGSMVRLGTFLILTAIMLWNREFFSLFHLPRQVVYKLVLVGILGFLLDVTSFIGFQYSNAATGTVLLKTDVLMANMFSIVLYKEKFRFRDWLYTLTMLAGVFLVLNINPASMTFKVFDLFFLLSAFFVTLNAFLIKHIQQKLGLSNNIIAYYNNFFAFLLFTLAMLFTGHQGDVAAVLRNPDLFSLIALCGLTQTLVYVFYYKGLAALPVWIVKSILLLIPVFTMIFNLVFFGQSPSFIHITGSVLVLASAGGLIYSHSKAH